MSGCETLDTKNPIGYSPTSSELGIALCPVPCASHSGARAEIKIETKWGGRRRGAGRKAIVHPEPILVPTEPEVRWYCVRTDFRAEILADIEIRRLGLTVFLPQEFRPARSDRAALARGQSFDRIVPVFPRYLFAAFDVGDDAWRSIPSRNGVERIFGTTPERPTPIPTAVIDILLSQCSPNGVIYPPPPEIKRPHVDIPKGTTVKLVSGPFAGFHGVCQLSAPNRIRLLVDMFGRATEVAARPMDVEVVV